MPEIESILRALLEVDPTPLILAIFLSGLIGLEREMHGRPAGLRTHILVCLASTLLILVTRNLPGELTAQLVDAKVVIDPTRLAAGIVTGIGFLGAACVIRAGDIVRGITTGACIWSVSALGIVIGFEAYGLAIVATGSILLVLVLLDRLEGLISPVIYRRLVIRCDSRDLSVLASKVRAVLKKKRIRVQDLTGFMGTENGQSQLVFRIRCRNNFQAPEMLEQVCGEQGVLRADWD